MSSYDSMKTKLVATGLYSDSDSSNTAEEIRAFAQGIDLLFDKLDEMTREYFICTAESYGITDREKFIGKERLEYSTEQRREMLLIQEQIIGSGCSKGDFELMLRGVGLSDFTITESFTTQAVTVTINDTLEEATKQMIEKKILAEFPAHLDATVTFTK